MKTTYITFLIAAFAVCTIRANAQQGNEYGNVVNSYGPPTFTGGTAPSPSESFALSYRNTSKFNLPTTIETIYPNPAMSTSSVVLSEVAINPVVIYIVNMNGTIVRTYTYDGGYDHFNFDVSSLQDGLYNIQVQERGKSMQSIKLLKQS